MTTEQFLAEYWQQRPLFCPQALPHFQSPVTAEELAGLAMEPDIDSRMVWQDSGVWHQQTGPFAENAFRGEMPWTLLVQGVDRYEFADGAIVSLRVSLDGFDDEGTTRG